MSPNLPARGWTSTLLAAVALACGSGASGTGNGGTGSSQRAALDRALDRVHGVVSKGPNYDLAAIQQAVLSDPAVQLVAPPTDNSLWITAGTDGPLLVVAIDPSPGIGAPPRMDERPGSPPRELGANELAAEVPGKPTYRVYMGLGDRFTDPTGDLAAMLAANGYTSAGTGPATVAELRAVKDAGVFFIKTHGARLFTEKQGLPYYALFTATPYPMPVESRQDIEDMLSRRLTIFDALNRNTWPWTEGTAEERHYAITPAFVSEYMTLAPNGFVMINACLSSAYPWLRDAFFAKGASLFAGWDGFVEGSASDQTARYVFDRLLGANKFRPESPPQRAFDYVALGPDLIAKGLDHTAMPVYGVANFRFFPQSPGAGVGLLAPSIKSIDFVENAIAGRQLILNGLFGARQGTVFVGSEAPAIRSWTADKIVTDLPSGGGAAVVAVDHHRSNDNGSGSYGVPITDWKNIQITYELRGPGTLFLQVVWNVHVRAHVQTYRDQPGQAPPVREALFAMVEDSKARYVASGSHSGINDTVSWSGAGEFSTLSPNPVGQNLFALAGVVDAGQHTMRARATAVTQDKSWAWTTVWEGGTTDVIKEDVNVEAPPGVQVNDNFLQLALDDKLNVVAGALPAFDSSAFVHGAPSRATWSWQAAPATSPPTDLDAR